MTKAMVETVKTLISTISRFDDEEEQARCRIFEGKYVDPAWWDSQTFDEIMVNFGDDPSHSIWQMEEKKAEKFIAKLHQIQDFVEFAKSEVGTS